MTDAHATMSFPDAPQHPDVPPAMDAHKKTILIYSPDLNFCFSLSMLFQDKYNVVTTTNAGLLEPFVKHYEADLVIVDAVPTPSIVQKLDSLKTFDEHLPVIILYVYGPRETVIDSDIRSHVDSVFYKPFDIADVAKRIDELLPH